MNKLKKSDLKLGEIFKIIKTYFKSKPINASISFFLSVFFVLLNLSSFSSIYSNIHEFGHGASAVILAQLSSNNSEQVNISWTYNVEGKPIQTIYQWPKITNFHKSLISLGGGFMEVLVAYFSFLIFKNIKINKDKLKNKYCRIFLISCFSYSLFHSFIFADTDGWALAHKMKELFGIMWNLIVAVFNVFIILLGSFSLFSLSFLIIDSKLILSKKLININIKVTRFMELLNKRRRLLGKNLLFKRLKENKYTFVCLVLAISATIIFINVRQQPWEYIVAFCTGLFFANFKSMKKTLIIASLILWLVASIMDPLMKNHLDKIFEINTISSTSGAFIINGLVLFVFWIGYWISKKIQKLLNIQ